MQRFRSLTAVAVVCALALASIAAPASAALVTTERMLGASAPTDARAQVDGFLAREDVRRQLEAWGVPPAQAEARIAALSPAELQRLAAEIERVPAGGGLLEVFGVVFVVLLILELVGVINVFSRI
ncbi:MAG: PA2779 family protein [Pseudomonadota bacterium]